MGSKPRLVLHIGTEKTGTTSIQEFLRLNASQYLEEGVFVPSCLGFSNHSLLPVIAYRQDRKDDLSLLYAADDAAARARLQRETMAQLQQLALQYPQHTFVVSSEHLQSRLTEPDELRCLRDLLQPVFADIRIVVYVRKPIDTVLSSLSTGIKCGLTATRVPPPSDPYIRFLCMHRETVERWAAAFGLVNVKVRLFNRHSFVGGDLLKDFASVSGIPFHDGLRIPPRTNEKLGFDGLRFLGFINEYVPYIADNRFNPLRDNLVDLFEVYFCDSKEYLPTREEVQHYADYYRDSDSWIRETFFPDCSDLWPETVCSSEPSLAADAASASVTESVEQFNPEEVKKLLRLLAHAWNEKQTRIHDLRKQLQTCQEQVAALSDQVG